MISSQSYTARKITIATKLTAIRSCEQRRKGNTPESLHAMKSKTIIVRRADEVGMSLEGEARLKQASDPFVVFRGAFGFIPNLLRAQAALPRLVAAHAKLEEAVCLRDGAISRVHKEQILLRIAADRGDNYCVALDTELLTSLGVPESHIDNLLKDCEHADLFAADLTLLDFCLKLSRDSSSAGPESLEALRPLLFRNRMCCTSLRHPMTQTRI